MIIFKIVAFFLTKFEGTGNWKRREFVRGEGVEYR